MSATNRGARRVDKDNYPTPGWVTRRLLEAHVLSSFAHREDREIARAVWHEPCAGEGAIIREIKNNFDRRWPADTPEALLALKPLLLASDIRPGLSSKLIEAGADNVLCGPGADCTAPVGMLGARLVDVTITNPPFGLALPIAQRALERSHYVALLLRLNWLAPKERSEIFRSNMPDLYVLPDRPNFVASCKCKGVPRRLDNAPDGETWLPAIPGCGWAETIAIDEPRFTACPECGGRIQVSTSDACEYAWHVWTPERGRTRGNVVILPATPEEERNEWRTT